MRPSFHISKDCLEYLMLVGWLLTKVRMPPTFQNYSPFIRLKQTVPGCQSLPADIFELDMTQHKLFGAK